VAKNKEFRNPAQPPPSRFKESARTICYHALVFLMRDWQSLRTAATMLADRRTSENT